MKISYYRIDALLSVFALSSAETSPPPYARTNNAGFGTVTTTTNGSITRAVCNNPPINLYDEKLIWDIYDFLLSLQTAPESRKSSYSPARTPNSSCPR
jgi:hypothetical protein